MNERTGIGRHDYTSAEGDCAIGYFSGNERKNCFWKIIIIMMYVGMELITSVELPGAYPKLSDQDIKDGAFI